MEWENYLKENQARFVDELLEFLRIPSVSSLSEHEGDVEQAAQWVAGRLSSAGLENIEVIPTDGHPLVYGDWLHAEGKPTIMIYGHFDVQPADPLELWTSPPFEPVIDNGCVYARGASDDKGNMLTAIIAVEALLKGDKELPVNVKLLFEGQEEIGSPQVPDALSARKEQLSCDMIISADSAQLSEERPALLLGFKGVCGLQVDLLGPKADLHSGIYGGAVQNPIHALARILDTMRGSDGRILVEGFYDSVIPLSEEDRKQIAEVPHDEADYMAQIGVEELFGETGFTTSERANARPTLEINGIWGGFQGEGLKTVLPSEAHAKITCRLVPGQDPNRILDLLSAHITKHALPGVKVTITCEAGGTPAYSIPFDHPGNKAAHAVLEEMYGCPPVYTRSGGSLPICSHFREILGANTVMFAWGLLDENIHSPNEFFRLSSFERGQKGYCMLLKRLA